MRRALWRAVKTPGNERIKSPDSSVVRRGLTWGYAGIRELICDSVGNIAVGGFWR